MNIPHSIDIIDAEESDYLYNQPSTIANAGNGLFTAIHIFKHERIAIYHGEILSSKEANTRIKNNLNAYFMNLPNGKILDCNRVYGFAKYANDVEGKLKLKGKRNNALITLCEEGTVCLVALRDIKANEEIFCAYGKRYWEDYHTV